MCVLSALQPCALFCCTYPSMSSGACCWSGHAAFPSVKHAHACWAAYLAPNILPSCRILPAVCSKMSNAAHNISKYGVVGETVRLCCHQRLGLCLTLACRLPCRSLVAQCCPQTGRMWGRRRSPAAPLQVWRSATGSSKPPGCLLRMLLEQHYQWRAHKAKCHESVCYKASMVRSASRKRLLYQTGKWLTNKTMAVSICLKGHVQGEIIQADLADMTSCLCFRGQVRNL